MIALFKALVLASVAHSPAPSPAEDAVRKMYPLVHQVRCEKARGTAFRIASNTMLSVAHVTDNKGCKIDGEPVSAVKDDKTDFSIITTSSKIGGFVVNCGGFIPGQWYFAVGYANGAPWQTMVMLYATIDKDAFLGMRVLRGNVIPGMSGGPILNAQGEVVGTVNAHHIFAPISYSLELKDTPLCA